jgi:hypothetical protein
MVPRRALEARACRTSWRRSPIVERSSSIAGPRPERRVPLFLRGHVDDAAEHLHRFDRRDGEPNPITLNSDGPHAVGRVPHERALLQVRPEGFRRQHALDAGRRRGHQRHGDAGHAKRVGRLWPHADLRFGDELHARRRPDLHVPQGRRLKTTNSGGTIYSTITNSVFGALTTVTVVNDSGTLDSGLSAFCLGQRTLLRRQTIAWLCARTRPRT